MTQELALTPRQENAKASSLEETLFWYLSKKEIPGAACQPWRGKIIIRAGFLGEGETVVSTYSYSAHMCTLLHGVGQDVHCGSMEAALFVNSCTLELLWND